MNSTYTKTQNPSVNGERLLELWESFGRTRLFSLEVDFSGGLTHRYVLKKTNIVIVASSYGIDNYNLRIMDDGEEISPNEFWERIPSEYKKALVFHLDQLL